jgi:purine-binding chemotaxis protein CheW
MPNPYDGPNRPLCTFRLGDALFGIDVHLVKEVAALPYVTRIPQAPPAVFGCVNLRGQIHLVLDLKQLLGLGPTQEGPDTRLVLFKSVLGDPFGILADRIGDIVQLAEDQVEDHNSAASPDSLPGRGLVIQVGKLPGELLLILDGHKLLPVLEQSWPAREIYT